MPQLQAELVDYHVDRWVATTPGSWIVIIQGVRVVCPKSICEFYEDDSVMTMPKWFAAKQKDLP